MKTTAILGLLASTALAACSSSPAAPESARAALGREELVDLCVKNLARQHECREEFISAVLRLNARLDPKVAERLDAPEEFAAAKATGIEELAASARAPAPKQRAECLERIQGADASPAERDQIEACWTREGCQARIECLMPVLEPMFVRQRAAKAAQRGR